MDFDISPSQRRFLDRVVAFTDDYIRPAIPRYVEEMNVVGEARWKVVKVVEELKAKAKAAGLWNFFMPPRGGHAHVDDRFEFEGVQLSNLEFSLISEQTGKIGFASEVFNCSAPDAGNMEVLWRFGSLAQKERWLRPLMNGEIRSAFLMAEPATTASDGGDIETRIERDGDHYIVNGRKWWSSGVGDPRCEIAILMGKSELLGARHHQQSQILLPMDTPGIEIVRMLPVFGYDDAPHGHAEVVLKNVRVPIKDSLLLGEGRGLEIMQGRLGPGRVHHCMRSIGAAEVALEKMVRRLSSRAAHSRAPSDLAAWEERVADARINIEMCRLLCLKAADMMDKAGDAAASLEVAMVKVAAPNIALKVIDDAIQAHGGAGLSKDFGLASAYAHQRTLRLADGPDEVHARMIAQTEFAKYGDGHRRAAADLGLALEVSGIR